MERKQKMRTFGFGDNNIAQLKDIKKKHEGTNNGSSNSATVRYCIDDVWKRECLDFIDTFEGAPLEHTGGELKIPDPEELHKTLSGTKNCDINPHH